MKKILSLLIITLSISAQGFICAVGGGSEERNGWSDKPYGWMVEKADSGKIVIISYEDNSDWLPKYFEELGAAESYIINIDNSSIANAQTTYDDLKSAKGIFIKGGNQETYYNRMNGTLSEQAIIEIYESGGVIGGTSAGAMVLSEFSSLNTVYPDEMLINPFNGFVQIEDDFINIMPDALFDTHFVQRGRWGRLIGFLYNIFSTTGREILGIGIDDQTAICIDNNVGTVFGSGAVSIFQIDERTRIVDQGKDYTIENLKCDQLTENWSFNFNTKSVSNIPSSAREVTFPIPFYYATHDAYMYGGDSYSELITGDGLNKYLAQFLNDFKNVKFGLMYNSGYEIYADVLADSLLSRNIKFAKIEIAADLINSSSSADSISSCDAFILISNDLESMSLASDRNTPVGDALYQKMISNHAFYFHGSTLKLNGEYLLHNTEPNPNSAYYGRLETINGFINTPDVIYQNDIFTDSDLYENRTAAVLYGMMRKNKRFGVYLNTNDYAIINSAINELEIRSDAMPIMVIDGYERTHVDSSTYKMSGSANERQVVAMNNLRYSVSRLEKSFNLIEGTLSPVTDINNEENVKLENDFALYENYPNPFNPSTTIMFSIPTLETGHAASLNASLKVYDILGREIKTLLNNQLQPGKYKVEFDASDLSSGVYFYRLSSDKINITKKMLLLK